MAEDSASIEGKNGSQETGRQTAIPTPPGMSALNPHITTSPANPNRMSQDTYERSLDDIMLDPFNIQDSTQLEPEQVNSVIPSIEDPPSIRLRKIRGFNESSDEEDDQEEHPSIPSHSSMQQADLEDEDQDQMGDDDHEDSVEPILFGEINRRDDGTSLFVPDNRSGPSRQISPLSRTNETTHLHPRTNSRPPLPIGKLAQLKARKQKIQNSNSTRQSTHQQAVGKETDLHTNTDTVQDEYDAYNKKAESDFLRQKRHYDKLKERNGKLNFAEEVMWLKIQQTENARQRKLQKEARMAGRDMNNLDLFPNLMSVDSSPQENDTEGIVDLDSFGPTPKRKRPEMPRKQGKPFSIQEAEIQAMSVALEASKELPRKKKPRVDDDMEQVPNSGGRAKATKAKSKAAAPKVPRRTAKDKKETARALKQATSLFGSNVFKQQAAQDAPAQPTASSRNKQEALKQLLATLPVGSKEARSDVHELNRAMMDFTGRGTVKSDGTGMFLVKGMATSLKPYQIMGTAFMRRRETGLDKPHGGLLADQMGLGKTLMMLANIVNGRPDKDSKHKATLIVASAGLLSQWADEINLHTDCGLKVMRYTTGSRIDSTAANEILNSHDIILTSYTEIMRSYPKNEPPIECQTTEEKIEWWKQTYEEHRGALHRIGFHRVVLDEAQAIKNYASRTSIACRALMAEHKWALSGTPILNNLSELYPYFKFLNVPHTGSFKIFKNNYCDAGNSENSERLLVRLSQFMLRRTHEDEWGGAPILKLPLAGQMTQWCDFNLVERSIYQIVETRFAKTINAWSKNKKLDKSYSNVLVKILRLRQLTSSLLMLQFVLQDLAEREDLEKIKTIVNNGEYNQDTRQGQLILNLRKQLEGWTDKRHEGSTQPFDDEHGDVEDTVSQVDTGREFGKKFDFKPYLNSLMTGEHWDHVKQKSRCSMCGGPSNQGGGTWLTSCNHITCGMCYEERELEYAETDQNSKALYCKACGQTFTHFTSVLEADPYTPPTTRAAKQNQQRADKERLKMEQQDIQDDWLTMGGKGVLPSAKTIAVKAQIINWMQEYPDVKIIIYTQFMAMIKILAKMCQEEGWRTEQYHGKLNFANRDKAIKNFANTPSIQILLSSLRCGGLGLNLTMASRVMILDPWWNSAAEQQAFCRVYRFGQQKTTFLTRLCVKNTIDERLIEMQERKQREIDEIMEDKGKSTNHLEMRDLMRLFGNVEEDESGNPFIVVDDPNPAGGFGADADHEGYADDL